MQRHAAPDQQAPRNPRAGHPHRKASLARACASALLGLVPVLAAGQNSYGQDVPVPRTLEDPSIAPVEGPSWITRRGVRPDLTTLNPATPDSLPGDSKIEAPRQPLATQPTLVLDGASLYRLNCLACHREEGSSAPPLPSSILSAVEGSSLNTIRQRLQQDSSRANLWVTIRRGTTVMPAREHLKDEDFETLSVYLMQPGRPADSERQPRRVSSWTALGEHVVKGTCHICHDAVGPRPTPQSVPRGEIPSLEALLATKSVAEFVRKAQKGLPVMADEPGRFHAGRMPRFDYLRDDEIATAYLYLAKYPPTSSGRR